MKNLTEDLKMDALNKWDEIIDDINNKRQLDYMQKYWVACGVHKAHMKKHKTCRTCKLNNDKNMPVCHISKPSYISNCFQWATAERWNSALRNAWRVKDTISKLKVDNG